MVDPANTLREVSKAYTAPRWLRVMVCMLSQAADLVAYLLQAGKFPPGRTELGADEASLQAILLPGSVARAIAPAASGAPAFPPAGNLAQVMRGILFPSSNIIFNVQTHDPSEPIKPGEIAGGATTAFSWVDWGAGIYSGWEIIDYASIALAESTRPRLTPS